MNMENRSHALAAGFFMLILGIAAVAAIWWLGQRREDVDYYLLETRGNVTGLNTQAPVRYRGIRAGRVEDVTTDDIDPRLIVVRISLAKRFHLTRGTVAQLNTQGITGLAYVQLEDDGKNPEVLAAPDEEPPRIRLQPSLLEQLGAQAGDIAVQAGELAIRLSRLLDDKNLRNLSRSLDNVAIASEGLTELPVVIASLRSALSEANVRRLSATLAGLEQTMGEATPLARELRDMVKTVTTLSNRLDRVAAETGAEVGGNTLPRINALTQELATASRDLTRLLELLERNPQSLVFGRSAAAPGPGESGFVAPKE
jgi:phospholipid/cholesterol/gamma-HCH transport system substrate-binding protein